MKSLFFAAACALALAHPIASFAQSNTTGGTAAAGGAVVNPVYVKATDNNVKDAAGAYGGTFGGSSQSGSSVDTPPAPGKTQRNPLGIDFGH